jgi:3-hydroxyisobutyrate dehydrogenase
VTKPAVGFIGLGVMGLPMARHLADAGYPMKVLDLDRGVAEAMAADYPNVAAVRTPREVGEGSEIAITMLPSGKPVQEVATGPGGLVEGMAAGGLLLDTSSSEPPFTRETAQRLASAGIVMVDAPVSGAEWGAKAADLVFMVGGADADVARVTPLLDLLGKQSLHLGGVGAGHTMKSINNLITSVIFMATGEGLIEGKRAGLDVSKMIDVLNISTGSSWISHTHFKQRIFNRRFDDPFKLDLMVKDIGIALAIAAKMDLDMPLSREAQRLWQQIQAGQERGASVSRLIAGMEQQAAVELS